MKRLIAKCMALAKAHRETLLYLIFGGLTTVVSFAVYFLFRQLNVDEMISNGLSWFFAVLFAFVTNKLFVFGSKSIAPKLVAKELAAFYSARLLTGAVDMLLFWVGFTLMGINDYIVKLFCQIVVIISNYFFSKLLVFRKKGDEKQ